jgi:orotate phosphoribosyltransferase
MNNTQLIYTLYQIGAIQLGEFKLKSGQTSAIYINLRKIISYPDLLRQISQLMWEKIAKQQCDLICGVPYTALPIATCISLEHHIPMVMRRKEKKDYGTKQSVEGEFKAGQTCLIIEDVITTGSSIIETAQELVQNGLQIKDVVVLVDREQGGKENLSQQFNVHTIVTLSEILATLLASNLLTEEIRSQLHALETKS